MATFTNQVVLITGAGSGIGRATAIHFGRLGAQVMVSDIVADSGWETVALVRETGAEANFVACDVAQADQVNFMVQQTVEVFGRIDIAVNNAGIGGRFARLTEQTLDDWNRMIAINLSGVFYGMQAQIRQMLQQGSSDRPDDQPGQGPVGGRIVNVASIAGVRGLVNSAPYTAAKHGVIGLTKAAALEYVRQGIRINAVCPVYTHSAMVDELVSVAPGMEERLRKVIPAGRFAQPEEIAQAIAWLCSEENSFCTGQALQMDGGLTAQ